MRLREGLVQLAARLDIAPSTVYRILRCARLNRLAFLDRATGEPVRRYEHDYPGSMGHVDVKKIGNIPDDGGWRYVRRKPGEKNRAATPNSRAMHTEARSSVMRSCTRSSTTTPASHTARSMTIRPPSRPSGYYAVQLSGSPTAASLSSEFCQTTAARTGRL